MTSDTGERKNYTELQQLKLTKLLYSKKNAKLTLILSQPNSTQFELIMSSERDRGLTRPFIPQKYGSPDATETHFAQP